MSKIKYVIIKEFQQIRRDKAMLAISFVMPIIQLLIMGYVISSEVTHISTVVCDLNQTSISRNIVERVEKSGYFIINYYENNPEKLKDYLNTGKAIVCLVIPKDMAQDLQKDQPVTIQVLLDGQDANTATITLGYLNQILTQFASEEMQRKLMQISPEYVPAIIQPETRVWYNPDLEYSDYMVPGIAIFLLTIVTMLLSAMGLVREREIGTMEQLLVTPLTRAQLLIGKILPFAILGFIELAIALVFARLWYHIPIVGNLLLFTFCAIIYLFTTLGLGLLVSATAHSQQQALFMSWFILIFMFLMSGFVFPIENMPKFAQYLTYLNPMRYKLVIIREIFIKGAGLQYIYEQILVLAGFGAVIFSFAVMRFQERVK